MKMSNLGVSGVSEIFLDTIACVRMGVLSGGLRGSPGTRRGWASAGTRERPGN